MARAAAWPWCGWYRATCFSSRNESKGGAGTTSSERHLSTSWHFTPHDQDAVQQPQHGARRLHSVADRNGTRTRQSIPLGSASRHSTSPPSCLTRLRTPLSPSPCDQLPGLRPQPLSLTVSSSRSPSNLKRDVHLACIRMGDGIAHQFAQDPRQGRPLHHAEQDVALEGDAPAESDVGFGQALGQVGLPFRGSVAQPMVGGGKTPGQCLQVLQRVPDVLFHLGRLGLVDQCQQARPDVVVKVLREAHALFAAALFDAPIERGRALKLFDDALRQKSVLRGEQALATPCEAKPDGAVA